MLQAMSMFVVFSGSFLPLFNLFSKLGFYFKATKLNKARAVD